MMGFLWVIFYSVFLLSSHVCAYDEVSDFCSRWDHQSIVKNDRLYIDGGNMLFQSDASNGKPEVLGINQKLIVVDLTTSWDWKTNISIVGIEKTPNPNTGTLPPSLVRGGIYAGGPADNNVYIFGGTKSQLNTSFSYSYPEVSTYSLWSFDTNGQSWNQYDVTSGAPLRPSRGSYAEAPDQGLAFYFNGQLDYGSAMETTDLGNSTVGLHGLIMLNMTSEAGPLARNLSTSSFGPDAAVASSELVYVSQVGLNGILVEMGGTLLPTSQPAEQNGTLVSFDSVNILDVNSLYTGEGNWYKQNTTGIIPEPRIDACSVVAAAPDNSSYNIYLYGGWDPTQGIIYDDIHILSLPSFTWTKMYSGESPRFGHTCHLVGNRQLLTVGGSLSMNLTQRCDWETKSVAIMDISTKQWGSVYNPNAPEYQITSDLLPVIGGGVSGGATMLQPQDGFSDPNLQAVFAARHVSNEPPPPPPNPTPPPPKASPKQDNAISGGVVAGIVIGAIAGVSLTVVMVLLMIRLKQKEASKYSAHRSNTRSEHPPAYEKDNGDYHEVGNKYTDATELAGVPRQNTQELPATIPMYELSGSGRRSSSKQSDRYEPESLNGSIVEVARGV